MRGASTATLRYLHAAIVGRATPCLSTISIGQRLQRSLRQQQSIKPARFSTQQRRHKESTISNDKTTTPKNRSLPTDTQALSNLSHYELFPISLPSGPPPKGPFSIDLKPLRNEFLQLQALAHPDRHPHNPSGQTFAQTLSARINEAYKTLCDPLLRAQYLLQSRRENKEDEVASKASEAIMSLDEAGSLGTKEGDQELLMEVLELREAIEEAVEEEEIERLQGENSRRKEESIRVLEGAFAADDLVAAAREAVRLRYWVNVEETLKAWEKGKPVVLEH